MRWFNLIFVFLFIAAAVLQYNDPDPVVWILLYLYGAFFCYRCFRGKFNLPLYWIGLAVYVPYAVYLFFDKTGVLAWAAEHNAENIAQTMKATRPWIEETREFFGLVILIAALMANYFYARRSARHRRNGTEDRSR